jgi:hypothetical protein
MSAPLVSFGRDRRGLLSDLGNKRNGAYWWKIQRLTRSTAEVEATLLVFLVKRVI